MSYIGGIDEVALGLSNPTVALAKPYHLQATPLDSACGQGNVKVVRRLLKKGAKVGPLTLRNCIQSGPYEYASSIYYDAKVACV